MEYFIYTLLDLEVKQGSNTKKKRKKRLRIEDKTNHRYSYFF